MTRWFIILLLPLALAACGKKPGIPQAPEGAKPVPVYPNPDLDPPPTAKPAQQGS